MSKTIIDRLVYTFSKLPGIGQRSARRVVLYLIDNKDMILSPLTETMLAAIRDTIHCEICGNIDTTVKCSICLSENRDKQTICVVETISDLWAFERSGFYKGVYHVLGGTLSGIDKRGPNDIAIEKLLERVSTTSPKEIILATNATMDGQTTAFYIIEKLNQITQNCQITRLAYGMPVGGELDYLDEGTLSAAFQSRKSLD
jgi:recombination protein RecR